MDALSSYRGALIPRSSKFDTHDTCKCYFIPPHIQEKLKQNEGDPAKRSLIERDLAIDTQIRSERTAAVAFEAIGGTVQITVYDAKNKRALPGELVESPQDSKDGSARRAYEGAMKINRYFQDVHQRNSIDGRGMGLVSTVHYDDNYNNAFWNSRQMVYGDGDGITFTDFTSDFDIIAHELSHGVVGRTAGLVYQDQPGALNESICDVFASCAKQFSANVPVNEADWLIGDKVLLGSGALRSLKKPGSAYFTLLLGKDPQPSKMSDYDKTTDDNGGVHINSGIPNHAFYLAATEIGGFSWQAPAKIWYQSLLETRYNADFLAFANTTISVSERLYEAGSKEAQAVRRAWETVEVFAVSNPPGPKDENECCIIC